MAEARERGGGGGGEVGRRGECQQYLYTIKGRRIKQDWKKIQIIKVILIVRNWSMYLLCYLTLIIHTTHKFGSTGRKKRLLFKYLLVLVKGPYLAMGG